MIGHQRDILASLGIDIWVSRTAVSQYLPQSSVWRDQAAPELQSEIIVPTVTVVSEQNVKPIPSEQRDVSAKNATISPEVDTTKQVEAERVVEVRSMLHIEAFSIEAIQLVDCLILCDSTALSQEQQQLWRNIQFALQAQYHALQWPFALEILQDGIGVENYVQGFVDALCADKHVISLGKIPHFNSEQCQTLADLQEMLDQPLLKKQLWNAIQVKSMQNQA